MLHDFIKFWAKLESVICNLTFKLYIKMVSGLSKYYLSGMRFGMCVKNVENL